ncbi:hypothetical protein BJX65DRAFT_312862 [Aspergillus insuetus]
MQPADDILITLYSQKDTPPMRSAWITYQKVLRNIHIQFPKHVVGFEHEWQSWHTWGRVIQESVSAMAFDVDMPTLVCCRGLCLALYESLLVVSTSLYTSDIVGEYFPTLTVGPIAGAGGLIIDIMPVQSQSQYFLFQLSRLAALLLPHHHNFAKNTIEPPP